MYVPATFAPSIAVKAESSTLDPPDVLHVSRPLDSAGLNPSRSRLTAVEELRTRPEMVNLGGEREVLCFHPLTKNAS